MCDSLSGSDSQARVAACASLCVLLNVPVRACDGGEAGMHTGVWMCVVPVCLHA